MNFLRVSVTFYDAVNMFRDIITIVNPFPYTAIFMLVVRSPTNQALKHKWNTYTVLSYVKNIELGLEK